MKPKQEVETRPSENQNQNDVEQSKSSDKRSSQSQSVKLTEEEDLPDLKILKFKKQHPSFRYQHITALTSLEIYIGGAHTM